MCLNFLFFLKRLDNIPWHDHATIYLSTQPLAIANTATVKQVRYANISLRPLSLPLSAPSLPLSGPQISCLHLCALSLVPLTLPSSSPKLLALPLRSGGPSSGAKHTVLAAASLGPNVWIASGPRHTLPGFS